MSKEKLWSEAKRHCHLSNEALQMAKEMGFRPQKPDQEYSCAHAELESAGGGLDT